MLQIGANMGAEIVNKSIKMGVKNNIKISSKNLTPAHPAFWPLSNLPSEENRQKNTNKRQKTTRGTPSERGTTPDEPQHAREPAARSGFFGRALGGAVDA